MIHFPSNNSESTFSVASYNIHRCVGLDRRCSPERIARVIGEIDADIIALQEIDSRYHKRNGHRQLDYLTRATGLHVISGPTIKRGDGHYGNALLTKHRVHKVRRADLSVPGREPRGAIDVDLVVRGRPTRIIATHLGLGIYERRGQIRRLWEIFSDKEDRVDDHLEILIGDFNEWLPVGRPLGWIHEYFGNPPHRLTFPSWLPVLPLDRIWVRPQKALMELCVHTTRLSRIASDHLPIKAVIALNGIRKAKGANGTRPAPGGAH